jgi:SagB-type dehydrogenase family enzyme
MVLSSHQWPTPRWVSHESYRVRNQQMDNYVQEQSGKSVEDDAVDWNADLQEDATDELKVNPFIRIQFGPPIVCDLLLEGSSVIVPDSAYLELITQLDKSVGMSVLIEKVERLFSVGELEAEAIITDLRTNRLLVNASEKNEEMDGVRHWIRRGWLDALVLHLKSRNIDCLDDRSEDSRELIGMNFDDVVKQEGIPAFWKEYPDCPVFELPEAQVLPEDQSFEEVLLRRRSFQPWAQDQLKLSQLSTILSLANKESLRLRNIAESEAQKRPEVLMDSSFSALETYFFAFSIESLPDGLYHYDIRTHCVHLIKEGLFRDQVAYMCIGQRKAGSGSCAFLVSAVFERYMYRYRHPRAYRNLLINVAEFAHRYILLSTALGLSTFMTPALQDEYADDLVGVNGYEEAPLYVVSIG